MMKKMAALALAALLLLTALTACAESSGTRLDLTKMKITLRGSDNKDHVSLHGMTLSLAAGSAEGVPTLQATLDYDEQVDSVFQVVDGRLLLSMGGITGTYYVDLGEAIGDAPKGRLMAAGVGAGLLMFGSNPDMAISLAMPLDKKGRHVANIEIPRALYLDLAERFLGMLEGSDFGVDAEALRKDIYENEEKVRIKIIYNAEAGKIWIRFLRGKKGVQLYARTALTTGPMEFINISADEGQHDLLNLDEEVLMDLSTDLDFMSMKAERFFTGVHLDKLTGSGESAQAE